VPFDPDAFGPLPAGVTRRRSRVTELLAPAGLSDAGLVGELRSIADGRSPFAADGGRSISCGRRCRRI
jgi:hypothetical protein